MPYTLSKAYSLATTDRYNTPNKCLQQVREWWGVPSKYPSAISAWRNARYKYSGVPPKGAPVFYSGGQYGHVAFSLGNGYVRSTDAAGTGRVGTVPLNWFKANWGYTYLGWTRDLNGVTLPFPVTVTTLPAVDLSLLVTAARTNPPMATKKVTYSQTVYVERALAKIGYLGSTSVDGHYGKATIDAYARWQRSLGYSGGDANGVPGMSSLTALGRKTGLFRVVA
jgi:hypothetical protein